VPAGMMKTEYTGCTVIFLKAKGETSLSYMLGRTIFRQVG